MAAKSKPPASTQNREPPAFQEYAAAMLAKRDFQLLSLAERGLLYNMRLECWVNHNLPESPGAIAKILGFDRGEVEACLPAVMPFFVIKGGLIVCPELEDYRAHLARIRKAQSVGGKDGADKTNEKRQRLAAGNSPGNSSGNSSGDSSGDCRVSSTVKYRTAKSKAVSRKEGFPPICDEYREWMGDPVSSERPGMVEVEI